MIRKFGSIFGLVAIIAFFLPWLKACDQVESGFGLLITGSLKDFSIGSLSSLNTGLLFLLIPAYYILTAWFRPRWIRYLFAVLAVMSFWNIGIWGGFEVSALIEEWGTKQHLHSIKMAQLAGIAMISAVALIVFLFEWRRRGAFNFSWSSTVLSLPLFVPLGVGFTIEPHYYGLWLYLFSAMGLFISSIIDAIWGGRLKSS